ncbi:MAG: hypothetical protein IKT98_12230 [Selenomonadaceae bacterium]|nr:hypothetical protein [Selenomonadaceae bacterium]
MGSFVIDPHAKPRYTYEEMCEIAKIELEKLKNISDEEHDKDIDVSDIPPTSKDELKKFFRINPRTPEQWEQYYKYCPLHMQKRHEEQRKLYGKAIL